MRNRLVLAIVSMLGLAAMSTVLHAQLQIGRQEEVRTLAIGGEGSRDFLEVGAALRRLDVSRATYAAVTDLDSSEVVAEIAVSPPADADIPVAGAEG